MSVGKIRHEGGDTEGGVVIQKGSVMDDGEEAETLHACWSSDMGLEQKDGDGVIEKGLDKNKENPLNARLTQLAELVEKNCEVAVINISYSQSKQKMCFYLMHMCVYYKPENLDLKRGFCQSTRQGAND